MAIKKTLWVILTIITLTIIYFLFSVWAIAYLKIDEMSPWMTYREIWNPFPWICFILCITFLLSVIYFRITYNLNEKIKIVLNIILTIFLAVNFSFLAEPTTYLMTLYWWWAEGPLLISMFFDAEIFYALGLILGVFILAFPFLNLIGWVNNFIKDKKHILNYTILFALIWSIGFFSILPEKNILDAFKVIPDAKVVIKWKQLIFLSQQFNTSVKIDFYSNSIIPSLQNFDNPKEVYKVGWIEDHIITFTYFKELSKKLEWNTYNWKSWAKEHVLWIWPWFIEATDMNSVLITKKDIEKRNKLLQDGVIIYQKCFVSDEDYRNCFSVKEWIYDSVIKELIDEFGMVEIDLWDFGKFELGTLKK